MENPVAARKVLWLVGTAANRIGGVEVLVRETAIQLKAQGLSIVVVFNSEPSPRIAQYLQIEGLTIESLADLKISAWRKNESLRFLLKKHRPDIVHWQFLDALSPIPWLSWWYGARQVCCTIQTSPSEGYMPRRVPLWKLLIARMINLHLTHMFCVSDYVKGVIAKGGQVPEERIHRIYNAVDLPSLDDTAERARMFRRTYDIPDQAPLIVQVSWLIPEKGIEDLLHAAKLVLTRFPEARFVIVGEGHYEARLEQLAGELGIGKSILWVKFLSNATQCGLYDAADIVCQLSRWEEAFGYVIAEAMSFAKPVVATRVGGIPEVVTHEKTGLLAPPRDPATVAGHICRLLADPILRREFGESGRRAVEENFNVFDRVCELLHYYGLRPDHSAEDPEKYTLSVANRL
jgi:glycosyltransferase involved in cell wall biosynthesis